MRAPELTTASAVPAPRVPAPSRASLPVRLRDVTLSEWTKLRSIRSNLWTLLAACVITMGGTVIVATSLNAARHAVTGGPLSALTGSFLAYAEYSVLPVGVLAVIAYTSEYSTGRIRTTLTAVPQRWMVLAAKALVAGVFALVLGEVLAFATFLTTQAILSGHHRGLSLSHPGVPGAVLAAGFVLAVTALLGVGLGAIIRHTAGGITALVVVLLLTGVLCVALPSAWNDRIGKFTPAFAAYQVTTLHPAASLLSPTWSMLILLAWPAVALALAAILISRRDA